MEFILNISIIAVGMFTAAIFYQTGMTTGKTLILLGLLANFLAITLRFEYVTIQFWSRYGIGIIAGLVFMFPERHMVADYYEKQWNNISQFWLGSSEDD